MTIIKCAAPIVNFLSKFLADFPNIRGLYKNNLKLFDNIDKHH